MTRQGGVRLDKLRMGLGRQQRGNVSPRGGFWIERNPFHPCIDRPVVNIAWLTSVFIDQNLSPTSITLNGIVLDCSNEMFYCVHFDRLNKTFNWKGCFSRQNANSGCVSEWGGGGVPIGCRGYLFLSAKVPKVFGSVGLEKANSDCQVLICDKTGPNSEPLEVLTTIKCLQTPLKRLVHPSKPI